MFNELWGGPYPLAVGSVAPTQTKCWFSTAIDQLVVWKWQTQTWVPTSSTVLVGANPPASSALGQLYVDLQNKLWVQVDDLMELTFPIVGVSAPADGAKFTASFVPPLNPSKGDLWFKPDDQDFSIWVGFDWKMLGTRVQRSVRIAYPLHTWNAGGFRTQAARAGDWLWIAGMRGINPLTQQQVPGPGPGGVGGSGDGGAARFNQVYTNIKTIVESEGLSLFDCTHLFSTTTNPVYIGPLQAAQEQAQFWGQGPFPPRTVSVVAAMSGSDTEVEQPGGFPRGDILEVQATFFAGRAR